MDKMSIFISGKVLTEPKRAKDKTVYWFDLSHEGRQNLEFKVFVKDSNPPDFFAGDTVVLMNAKFSKTKAGKDALSVDTDAEGAILIPRKRCNLGEEEV